MNPERIKTASVDVCALCSWRGPANDWAGHERSWEHRIARVRADARACGLVPLSRQGPTDPLGFSSKAIRAALGEDASVEVPSAHRWVDMKSSFETEPFVQQAVKTAVESWYALPIDVRRQYPGQQFLREMFPEGAPVGFKPPTL